MVAAAMIKSQRRGYDQRNLKRSPMMDIGFGRTASVEGPAPSFLDSSKLKVVHPSERKMHCLLAFCCLVWMLTAVGHVPEGHQSVVFFFRPVVRRVQ